MSPHMLNSPSPWSSPPLPVCYMLGSSLISPLVYNLPTDYTVLSRLKDYDHEGSNLYIYLKKKATSCFEPQGAWHKDRLNGHKLPVVKLL
jgi:hypothetical protein